MPSKAPWGFSDGTPSKAPWGFSGGMPSKAPWGFSDGTSSKAIRNHVIIQGHAIIRASHESNHAVVHGDALPPLHPAA